MSPRLCAECGERPPLFAVHGGKVRTDSEHDLCARCWTAAVDRGWAKKRADERLAA